LDFWASWCLPCIKALPLLEKIQAHYVSKNVVYISVSIDKKEKDWIVKEKQLHTPWPSLLADEITVNNYEIKEVPSYIVIDKNGKIVSKSSSLGSLYTALKELNK
jgi:thiol-disulfide isomerase/thioredoxin